MEIISCRGSNTSFIGTILSEAHFNGGDFSNSIFKGASLNYANIEKCKMIGVDFTEAKTLDIKLADSIMSLCQFRDVSLRRIKMVGVVFSEADFDNCDFRESIFEDCSMERATITKCQFDKADIRGVDLNGVQVKDISNFKGSIISRVQAVGMVKHMGIIVA